MKQQYKLMIFLFILLGFCLSLLGKPELTVQAGNTCNWTGATDINWFLNSNWSDCNNVVPTAADDVVIPAAATRFPTINWTWNPDQTSAWANAMTIETDAQLTIVYGSDLSAFALINNGTFTVEADDAPPSFGALVVGGSFTNNGTLNVHSTSLNNYFNIYPSFTNTGTVNLDGASLGLLRGGTHSGDFTGDNDSYLYLGSPDVLNQTFTFDSASDIRVNRLFVREGTANINGTYWPPAVGSYLLVQAHQQSAVLRFSSTANVVTIPENLHVENRSKIYFEARALPYFLTKVDLDTGGEINNLGLITISNLFTWYGGKISGAGSTELNSGTSASIRNSAYSTNIHELDGQLFINSGTVNWTGVDISLLNGAVFQNDGIFNANASTTMTGGSNESFENNGSFYKKTVGTTTTMDIDFANTGTVEVVAGTLNFLQNITAGSGTIVDLSGGALSSAEGLTLTPGASLVGSGMLNGDLENSGEVSPGSSPGQITVAGNYTQTADGLLTIELGGLTAGMQFDKLVVEGIATLAGDLVVTLIDPFAPQAGDQFMILTYASRIEQFDSILLPGLTAGLEWETEYTETGLRLTVKGPEMKFVFLPLLLR